MRWCLYGVHGVYGVPCVNGSIRAEFPMHMQGMLQSCEPLESVLYGCIDFCMLYRFGDTVMMEVTPAAMHWGHSLAIHWHGSQQPSLIDAIYEDGMR